MATVLSLRSHQPAPTSAERAGPRPWWLWLSVPIAVLGGAGSLAGILVDRVYRDETDNWAAQAVGQDIANLVVLAAMAVFGYAAAAGSLRAYLVWLGTTVYAAYTYAIYVFDVHFGPLFLLYVAVFGMSVWALVGGLANLEPRLVRAAFTRTPAAGFVSAFLVVLAGGFALLWLGQDVPAILDGTSPEDLRDTGLFTNPVHVLDLALFLPTAVAAGVLLRRRQAWGHVLAPVELTAMAAISAGIVAVTAVAASRGQDASWVVAGVIGLLAVVQVVACAILLGGIASGTTTGQVLRRSWR